MITDNRDAGQPTRPTTAVALAAHDGARWLPDQLRSIVGQTVVPDQVVMADDASSDATVDVARGILRDARLRHTIVEGRSNLGYVRNFERAIAATDTDLVFLCDQDDAWHADKIEHLIDAFGDPCVVLAFSDVTVTDELLVPQRLLLEGVSRALLADPDAFAVSLLRRNLVPGMAIVARRDFLIAALPVPEGWHHDHWVLSLAAWARGTAFVDESLVAYRTHPAQAIGPSVPRRRERLHRVRPAAWTVSLSAGSQARSARVHDLADRLEGIEPDAAARAREYGARVERALAGLSTMADLRALRGDDTPVAFLGVIRRVGRRMPATRSRHLEARDAGLRDAGTRPRIHFWVPDPPVGLDDWDPDNEPDRYSDGRSHAVYELAVRLRSERVSIGRRVPSDSDVVVLFAKDMTVRTAPSVALQVGTRPTVMIMSDRLPEHRLPFRPTVLITPLGSTCHAPDEIAVPLLPQRGLIPRDAERRGRVASVGYKGSAEQAPAFLRSEDFRNGLARLGLDLDPTGRGEPGDVGHDISTTDVVLCMRSSDRRTDHKPPTKVVNAWAAGCIPIVGPEPMARAIVRPGIDCLLADDGEDVLEQLGRLVREPMLVASLESGVAERQSEYAPKVVLAAWRSTIEATAARGRVGVLRATCRAGWQWCAAVASALRRRSPLR